MTLQTGWKLQPCFAPIPSEHGDPAPAPNNEADNNATTDTGSPAPATDSNGSTDPDGSNDVIQETTDASNGNNPTTPTSPHGND